MTGLRTTLSLLTACTIGLLSPGCIILESGDGGGGSTSGDGTGGGGHEDSGPGYTSGQASGTGAPCSAGTEATGATGYDSCGTGGCNPTSGGWGTDGGGSDTDDPGPGPLITTGNENAIEWDVTARHTFLGQPPVDGTYLTTTTIYMETDFQAVVAIPHEGGGGTSYAWIDGDHMAGEVTIVNGGVASFGIEIQGNLQISDTELDGSGTFHDDETHALLGTWEILDAVPRP
ncbi:MAG: hypothetical protein H6712_35070 [Myxococcales bacterium]|nr:hypothetical protein [Myxococcales bacterium]MCB9719121.1 hypothetical protein [Myxococcales bacterium]